MEKVIVKISFAITLCLLLALAAASPVLSQDAAQTQEAAQPEMEQNAPAQEQPAEPVQPTVPAQPPVPAQAPAATQPIVPAQPPASAQAPVATQPPAPTQPIVPDQPPASAQAPVATQPPVPTQPTVPAQPPVPVRSHRAQFAQPTVSFFFDDADIFEVAQTIFADVLKANYIIDPQVKGRVNFRTVTPIPRDEVLNVMETIFRLNGIGFVEEAGIYRIVPLPEVSKELIYSQVGKPPEKVAIEMFTFKNMDLKEAMPDIENTLGLHLSGGIVRIVPLYRLNSLIVVATSKTQLEYIKKWVEAFDDMFASIRPKIFVYPLQNSKADHIASLLQSILGGGGGATTSPSSGLTPPKTTTTTTPSTTPSKPTTTPTTQPTSSAAPKTGAAASITAGAGTFVSADTKIFADEITNSLIVLATPTDYTFIKETIKKIDIQLRQVMIEGLIAQVTLTDNVNFGFSWSLNTDVNISGLKPFTRPINLNGAVSNNSGDLDPTKTPGSGFTFVGTDPSNHLRVLLQAALEDSRGKVLAAPHILVSDNREAKIQIGSQVPLATSTTSYVPTLTTTTAATQQNALTSTVQYQDIGIILKVKPQINDSGLVSLELSQEVSSIGDNVPIAGQSFASINKTEATTNLVARDGETIIIGGLIREDVTKGKSGIPILSKIPLLGWLFSDVKDNKSRTELLILLTPHVVKNQQEAGDVTTDYVDKFKESVGDKDLNKFLQERSRIRSDDKERVDPAK